MYLFVCGRFVARSAHILWPTEPKKRDFLFVVLLVLPPGNARKKSRPGGIDGIWVQSEQSFGFDADDGCTHCGEAFSSNVMTLAGKHKTSRRISLITVKRFV